MRFPVFDESACGIRLVGWVRSTESGLQVVEDAEVNDDCSTWSISEETTANAA